MKAVEKEIRQNNIKFEVRQDDNKQTHLQGYAIVFDKLSENLGYFKEIIRRGALDDTDMSNVVLDINHDFDKILARNNTNNGIGSLTLTVDDKGLYFDAIPTDTSYARDLLANMEAGIINKCSFMFTLDYSDDSSREWDWDTTGERGYDIRRINKIQSIYDVSIVTNPAYEDTSCITYKRAKENFNNNSKMKILKRKLKLRLKYEE
ncbi:Phage prohead protease, HK97 family [Clostridium neonatale]|nr:Phage prohead protease, HK97 family [Clostridium neonatale]